MRLATSSARSGPHSTRPARGTRCPGSRHKATGALERYHIFLLVLSQPLTCCVVLHPYSLSVQCARSSGAMGSQRCLKRRAYDHQWLMQVAGSCGKSEGRSRASDARRKRVAALASLRSRIGSVYRHYLPAQPPQPRQPLTLRSPSDSWRPHACRTCPSPPRP